VGKKKKRGDPLLSQLYFSATLYLAGEGRRGKDRTVLPFSAWAFPPGGGKKGEQRGSLLLLGLVVPGEGEGEREAVDTGGTVVLPGPMGKRGKRHDGRPASLAVFRPEGGRKGERCLVRPCSFFESFGVSASEKKRKGEKGKEKGD